jgi:hypothetical protein
VNSQRWTVVLNGQAIAPDHPLDATATIQMFEAYVRQYPDASVEIIDNAPSGAEAAPT